MHQPLGGEGGRGVTYTRPCLCHVLITQLSIGLPGLWVVFVCVYILWEEK